MKTSNQPGSGYLKVGPEIYRQSFTIIKQLVDFSRFNSLEELVALRIIHSSGMPDIIDDLAFSNGAATALREALLAGAPIICDSRMVASGITRQRLTADNPVHCYLDEAKPLAKNLGTTVSAAAVDLWQTKNAIIAVGNAPTALFRLLEIVDSHHPPAVIIGMPVGFVGAIESKVALAQSGLTSIIVHGRRGGSAMAAATINALAALDI